MKGNIVDVLQKTYDGYESRIQRHMSAIASLKEEQKTVGEYLANEKKKFEENLPRKK